MRKRILSLLLVLGLVLSSFVPAYANSSAASTTLSDAKIVELLGVLVGEGNGITQEYLAKTPTRMQAAILYLRLKGLESEAEAYKGTSNFSDVSRVEWARNILAYIKTHPELGMVGVGNNMFSPEAPMTAQGYYKIMLEALDYKEGVDFKWEDTFSFAASKGLTKIAGTSKFTISNLATATVEALRAKTKDGNDTLGIRLVKLGKLTTDQGKLLDPITESSFSAGFDVAVKSSKSIQLKFSKAVADPSKVVFSVMRDNVAAESLSASWNADKTEVILSKPEKLAVGSYSIAVTYDKTLLGTKTFAVEQERLTSIEFSPELIIKVSDIKGEVVYRVRNQYGEDISTSPLSQNIKWTVSEGTVSVDTVNAKLSIIKDNTSGQTQLKDTKSIYVIGVDLNSKVTVAKLLTVSEGVGFIKEFRFLGIKNKDGKTDITVDSTDKFYIDYEAKDADGNKVDSYLMLSNASTFMLINPNPNIAAHVVRDPDNLSKALIEIDTHSSAGTVEITGIALSSGKSDVIKVVVKKGSVVNQLILEAPTKAIAVNERVEIPFKALDENGNSITRFDDINGKVSLISSDPSNSYLVGERKADGTFVIAARFNSVKQYLLTALVTDSGKVSNITVNTSNAAVPTAIASIDKSVIYPAIVENGEIRISFASSGGFKVVDQNDKEFNLKDNNVVGNDYYYINAVPADESKVKVQGNMSVAYLDKEIVLLGGNVRGTTYVKFELCKDTDNIPSNGKTVIDVKEVAIANVDKTKISSYEITPIGVLYADPDVTTSSTYDTILKRKKDYAADISIRGIMANGDKVALNPRVGESDVLNYSVTDANKFLVDRNSRKVIARTFDNGTEATDRLVATIMGANSQITTVSVDLRSKKEIPTAQSIDSVVGLDTTISKSGDSYTCNATLFNSVIVGHELSKYTRLHNNSNAGIYFIIKDQYGKEGLTPSYFALKKNQGTGTVTIDASTGLVSGYASSGDQYIITAVTNSGLTRVITVNIQ